MHKLRFKYSERNARLVGLIKMEPNTCVSGPDGWAVQCAVEWGRRGGGLPTQKEVLAAMRRLSIANGWAAIPNGPAPDGVRAFVDRQVSALNENF